MGADIKIVATQHFVRVVIVVTLVLLIFLLLMETLLALYRNVHGHLNIVTDFSAVFSCLCWPGDWKSDEASASHMMGPLFLGFVLSISGLIHERPTGCLT